MALLNTSLLPNRRSEEVAEALAEFLTNIQAQQKSFTKLDYDEILEMAEAFILDEVPELCS